MFSTRTPSDLAPNTLTSAELAVRAGGVRVIDLTETNPTRVGLAYPDDVLAPLAAPAGLLYDPHPFGLLSAREKVAEEIRGPGSPVEPARVILTASTSEAYAFLFKLLCEPGDEVADPGLQSRRPLWAQHSHPVDGAAPHDRRGVHVEFNLLDPPSGPQATWTATSPPVLSGCGRGLRLGEFAHGGTPWRGPVEGLGMAGSAPAPARPEGTHSSKTARCLPTHGLAAPREWPHVFEMRTSHECAHDTGHTARSKPR